MNIIVLCYSLILQVKQLEEEKEILRYKIENLEKEKAELQQLMEAMLLERNEVTCNQIQK